MTLKNTFNRIY